MKKIFENYEKIKRLKYEEFGGRISVIKKRSPHIHTNSKAIRVLFSKQCAATENNNNNNMKGK